jgi:hypothetical protein
MGIILSRNPVQGGSVVIRVSFRDEMGRFYVPIKGTVRYSLFALHESKETWEVVNSRYGVLEESKSVVDIVLQGADLAMLSNCTLQRRVVLDWQYMRAGELTLGRDTVDFEVVLLPVLDPPVPEVVPPDFSGTFTVEDVYVVRESSQPRIAVRFSCPVDASSVGSESFWFVGGDGVSKIYFGVEFKEDKTVLFLTPKSFLSRRGEWILHISGGVFSVLGIPIVNDGSDMELPVSVFWVSTGQVEVPVAEGVGTCFVVFDSERGVFIPFDHGLHAQRPYFFVTSGVGEGGGRLAVIFGDVPGFSISLPDYSPVYLGVDGTILGARPDGWSESPVVGFVHNGGDVYLYPQTIL